MDILFTKVKWDGQRTGYDERCTLRAREAFIAARGAYATVARALGIAALPSKEWNGVTVYKLTCDADYGRGPHEVWLPERILWSLIDLRLYRCAYHV